MDRIKYLITLGPEEMKKYEDVLRMEIIGIGTNVFKKDFDVDFNEFTNGCLELSFHKDDEGNLQTFLKEFWELS